jgi:hypothetical protein
VRDQPTPARLSYEECRKRSAEGVSRYWAAERPVREARRAAAREAAAAQIGELTDRELLIAGSIAYWCEGAKSKPHRRDDRVIFTNSDPALIRLFLRFLDATGTPRTDLVFRVFIHENADVESAQQFWLEVTGAAVDQFLTPTLKHHNPKTVRKNVGENYRLPSHRRPPQRRPLPQDRRLGSRRHGGASSANRVAADIRDRLIPPRQPGRYCGFTVAVLAIS